MKPFQLIVIALFIIAAVVGLLVFAGSNTGGGNQNTIGEVIIWGVLPQEQVRDALSIIRNDREDFDQVAYFEVPLTEFGDVYTEALAVGRGPDLVLIPHELIQDERETLRTISSDSLSTRTFEDLFIDAANIVREGDQYVGIPVGVDPLVMFFNRTHFNQARVSETPRFWEQFSGLTPQFVERVDSFGLARSFVALGSYENIRHADKILASLFFQVGSPIIDSSGRPALTGTQYENVESALRFFAGFANPNTSIYSWNRTLREDRQAFLAQELSIYLAPASEAPSLEAANPNLSFGVSTFPQLEGGTPVLYGSVYLLAIPRASQNTLGAQSVAFAFANRNEADILSQLTDMTPLRRDLLSVSQNTPWKAVAYEESFITQGWRSPQPEAVDRIFSAMVEDVVSGRSSAEEALETAAEEL